MRRLVALCLLSMVCASSALADVVIDEENFPDETFREYVSENFDKDGNGSLSEEEIASVTSIDVAGTYNAIGNIQSLKGVEHFTELATLKCDYNRLTELDVSENTKLRSLYCNTNQLAALDVSKNTMLTSLRCRSNRLTELDVSKNTALTTLECFSNDLTALDVSNNTALTVLYCNDNQLSELDVSKNTALQWLQCGGNQLTELDVSQNTALTILHCSVNQLTELDVSNNTALKNLYCGYNQLTSLDVSNNTDLTILSCGGNQLTSLDVSNNTALTSLGCSNSQLTTLDLSKNTALEWLTCSNNLLTTLDLSIHKSLAGLYCENNKLTALDLSNNTALEELECSYNQLATLDLTNNNDSLKEYVCQSQVISPLRITNTDDSEYPYQLDFSAYMSSDKFANLSQVHGYGEGYISTKYAEGIARFVSRPTSVIYCYDTGCTIYSTNTMDVTISGTPDDPEGIAINEENFPDEAFRAYVLNADVSIDKNQDGYLSEEEIANTIAIDVPVQGISSLEGIKYFTALISLDFAGNQCTEIDLSRNTALTYINCYGNQLTELDVSNNTALENLTCGNNKLTALDVSNNTTLRVLHCRENQLAELDVSNNTALTNLECYYNQLTELDVSNNTELTNLDCQNNQLTALDVSKNTVLTWLWCFNNQLTELDVSNNIALQYLNFHENQLTELDVSNNTALENLNCGNNKLTALDVSNNTTLDVLNCQENRLIELDVSNNSALRQLNCSNNQLTELDVSNNTTLQYLNCSDNQLTKLDVSNNTALTDLNCSDNQLTSLDVSNNTALDWLFCYGNQITTIDIRKCTSLNPLNTVYFVTDPTVLIIHGNTSSLPSFDKHSLVLSGQIGVDFYLSLPSSSNTTGSYVTFTVSGDNHNPVPFSDGISMDNGTYRFTCYINSVQMADEIEAMYFYSQDKKDITKTNTYSLALANTYTAKDYLDTIISNAPETSTDLVALAKAIKDYGHYVQSPLADYNGWEIGVKHNEMDCADENIDSDSSEVTAKLASYALSRDKSAGLTAGITGLQYSLELDSETTLNIYLSPDSEAGSVKAFITDTEDGLDGTQNMADYNPSTGTYTVSITGIPAHKLAKSYTVNVQTDKGSFDVKLCALSYADAVMKSDTTSDDLKKAVIALYKYYAATMDYRKSAGYTD